MLDTFIVSFFESFTYVTWWIVALILVFSEIFVGGGFILWLGISAFVVGGILFLGIDLSWQIQLVIFSITSVLSITLWHKFYKKRTEKSDHELLSRRADKYIGKSFQLIEPIENGVGKIKIEDTLWRVLGEDMPAGASVLVLSVEGSSFQVKLK